MTYWPDTENNQHLTCRNSILSFGQAFKSLAVSNLVNSVKDLSFVPSYFPSIPSPCLLSPSFHTCCSACSLAPVALYFLPRLFSSSSPYLTAQLFFHLLWTLQTFLRFWGSYEYLQLGGKKKRARMFVGEGVFVAYFKNKSALPLVKHSYQSTKAWVSKDCWRLSGLDLNSVA